MTSRSLHHELLEALGTSIIEGHRAPGSTFTTADIEGKHGVSRSVAREALRVLESLRLVRSSPRIGSTVLPRDDWNMLAPEVIRWCLHGRDQLVHLRALTELRSAIEPAAARHAARRATWTQYEELRETAARMAQLGRARRGDDPEFLQSDAAFHTTLLHATGNPYFIDLDETLRACLEGRNQAGLTPQHPAEENLENHLQLAEAVGRRDEDAAAQFALRIVTVVHREID